MANRLSLPRPTLPFDPRAVAAAARRVANWRPPRGTALRLLLYRLLWLPFWLGSDLPAPVPRQADPGPVPAGLAGDHVTRCLTRLARRVWLLRALTILVRALWLPLLVGCGWLALELAGGPPLRPGWLLGIGIALLLPAGIFAWLERPNRRQVARMLDRSFGLQDRMLTAVDHLGRAVPAPGERAALTYLQMADAANAVTELRGHPAFRLRPPVRELVLGIASALLLAALFFLRGVGGEIPALATDSVPAYVHAADRLAAAKTPEPQSAAAKADAPTVADVQAKAAKSTQAQQDLKQLADALGNQAATRAASEALDAGNYAEGATQLREVADHADQLSKTARSALADSLDQAADAMSPDNASLADATRKAADGLREGGDAAKTGLNDLADQIEQTAADVASQGQLASDMQAAQAADAQRAATGEEPGASKAAEADPGTGAGSGADPKGSSAQTGAGARSGADAGEGSGADAQPGEGSDEQPGQSGDQTQPGDGSGNQPGDQGGQSSQPGQGEGQAQAGSYGQVQGKQAESGGGEGDQPGDASGDGSQGQTQDAGNGEAGAAGAGAGSGSAGQGQDDSSAAGAATTGSTGDPNDPNAQPNVTAAQPGAGSGTTQQPADPRDAITLSRSPDANGQQTGGDSGSSAIGSGGGAAVSAGTTVQGEVGQAGPDSNRVPAEYRTVVEGYFSEDGS